MAPKVTLNQAAAPVAADAAPVKKAGPPGVIYATDSKGRRIGAKKLTALERMRVLKYVGAQASENRPYVGMAILAASVREIDGVTEPFPQNERQIEAIIGQLEDHGVEAVTTLLAVFYTEEVDAAEEDRVAGK